MTAVNEPQLVESVTERRIDVSSTWAERPGARRVVMVGITAPRLLADPSPAAGIAPLSLEPQASQVFHNDADANSNDFVAYNGGAVMISSSVQLIYWGSAWANAATPSMAELTAAAKSMVEGSYLLGLRQYGIGSSRLRGTTWVTAPDPPATYSSDDARNLVWNLIDGGQFPEPDDQGGRNFYAVLMPQGSTYEHADQADGAHGVAKDFDFPADIDSAWFCWIGHADLAGMSETLSHELVEAITDPENDGWKMNRSLNGGDEIGDACRHSSAVLDGATVQAYWSQRDRACIIPTVDPRDWSGLYDDWRSLGGIFPAGAPVTAVSRAPGNLDLFIVGNDGRVYTSWWSAGADWSGINDDWRPIGGFFRPGSRITAVARTGNNLDLFITGYDGRVYSSWWSAGVDWSGINDNWRSLGGFFPPGAPVAAAARTGNNLDLFITGYDGRVYSSWWYAGVDWSGINDNWRSLGGIFPAGAPVAAVARTGNNLDLFITGTDGVVYSSWWYAGVDWSGINDNWRPLGGFFPASAPVAAAARTGNNLDLFIVGNDGRIYSSWWAA